VLAVEIGIGCYHIEINIAFDVLRDAGQTLADPQQISR
jgi:hypothetical protein